MSKVLRAAGSLGALALALLAPPPASAQRLPVRPAAPLHALEEPGWIGFWYEVVERRAGPPLLVVDRTEPGSPAARAGLARGDTLLAVGGVRVSPADFRRLGQGLRVGDALRLTVVREGRRRDVRVVAEPRPGRLALTLELAADSVRRRLLARVDSVRSVVALMPGPPFPPAADARAPRAPRMTAVTVAPSPMPAPGAVEAVPAVGSARPFPVFVWTSDDTLTRRLEALEAAEREAVTARTRRIRELAVRAGPGGRVDERDPALVEAERRLRVVQAEAEALRARQAAVAWERAEAASRAPVVFHPLTPYAVGRDRAAGARLTPLVPGLAAYFGVGRGLLVVEVASGTPAEEAGLQPGDVVVAAAGVAVAVLDDLRRALGGAGERPVTLRVVRRGRAFDARLP